jgi:hypothetical protein
MYLSDGSAPQYKNRKKKIINIYHEQDFGLSAEWHFFATSHGKEPADGMGGTVKRLQRQVYRKSTVIKYKHLINSAITAAATYTALHSFISKKKKLLIITRNLQIGYRSCNTRNKSLSLFQAIELQDNNYSCYCSVHIFHNAPNNKKS